VPTLARFVPGYELSGFAGIGVPRGTPADIVALLNRELNAAVADADVRAKIIDLGGSPLGGTPAEFGKILSDAIQKWAEVIRFAGIKAD